MRILVTKRQRSDEHWLRKRATVFLSVASWAAIATAAGWAVGFVLVTFYAASEAVVEGGAFFGGWIGLTVGGLIGFRHNLFEAEWGRIVMIAPVSLWFVFGGLAAAWDLPRILIALVAAAGAGVGALLARYSLHFFDPDPPQHIF